MEVTVIHSVQTIVRNQDVTFLTERVTVVPLDGWEISVEMSAYQGHLDKVV